MMNCYVLLVLQTLAYSRDLFLYLSTIFICYWDGGGDPPYPPPAPPAGCDHAPGPGGGCAHIPGGGCPYGPPPWGGGCPQSISTKKRIL